MDRPRFAVPLLLLLASACGLCEGPEVAGTTTLRVERGQECPSVDAASAQLVRGTLRSVTGFRGAEDAPGMLVCVYDAHTKLPVFDGEADLYYFVKSRETCATAADVLRDRKKYPLPDAPFDLDAETLWGGPPRPDLAIVEVLDGPRRVEAAPDTCNYHVRLHGDEEHPIVEVRSVVTFTEGTLDVSRCPAPATMTSDAQTTAGSASIIETIDAPVVGPSSLPLGTSCTYDVIRRDDADHCG